MLTEKEFLTEFNGHENAYASFILIDVKLNDVIDALNELRPNGCFGSGKVDEHSVYFEGCKELPDDLLPVITAKLHCRGFSDMGSWYGDPCFAACENGYDYDDYTAVFTDNSPYPYDADTDEDDCDEWDVFVTVTDNRSGVEFFTGEGCISTDAKEMFEDIVSKHRKAA